MYNFSQIKNNFSIAYGQPMGFIKGALPKALYSVFESATTIIAKTVIHVARGLYDISCDIVHAVANLFKAADDQDSSCTKQHLANHSDTPKKTDIDAPNHKQEFTDGGNESTLGKLKNFVTKTWKAKDDTYLGKFSTHSECYPVAKTAIDIVCTLQGVAQTAVEEALELPAKVKGTVKSGLESACAAGITEVKHELTITEDGFINIEYEDEAIEMTGLPAAAAA